LGEVLLPAEALGKGEVVGELTAERLAPLPQDADIESVPM